MVARDALWLVGFGIALGLPLAWALSRTVQSMLFGLTATDPVTLAISVLLIGAAGLMAAYFPARRASLVDPMNALRHE
jgi:ABC-type antimicrobial peptide transport system permease subunit